VNRRSCLKYLALAVILNPVEMMASVPRIKPVKVKKYPLPPTEEVDVFADRAFAAPVVENSPPMIVMGDKHIKDYLSKVRHPNTPHPDDIVLTPQEFELLRSVVRRLERVRAYIGHGNFCILGFDDTLKVAKRHSRVGAFTPIELEFMEEIYFRDAKEYGFFGEKQVPYLTTSVPNKEV